MSNKEAVRETVTQFTEEMEVAGREVVSAIKRLLKDTTVHRIKVINDSHDEVVLDIPAAAGAGGAILFAGLAPWMMLGVAALYVMNFRIVIERRVEEMVEDIDVTSADEELDVIEIETPDEVEIAPEIEIVIEKAPADVEPVVEAVEQCQGNTKAGAQCKRKPMEGSAYCYAHQPA